MKEKKISYTTHTGQFSLSNAEKEALLNAKTYEEAKQIITRICDDLENKYKSDPDHFKHKTTAYSYGEYEQIQALKDLLLSQAAENFKEEEHLEQKEKPKSLSIIDFIKKLLGIESPSRFIYSKPDLTKNLEKKKEEEEQKEIGPKMKH